MTQKMLDDPALLSRYQPEERTVHPKAFLRARERRSLTRLKTTAG
jgi:hypothetical protein